MIEIPITLNIKIKDEDIDDIMCTALEGGITYWCNRCKVIGDYLGEYAHEQISKNGELRLYDAEENNSYVLTLKKFKHGISRFLHYHPNVIDYAGYIDTSEIDSIDADAIIQYALFDEIIYG